MHANGILGKVGLVVATAVATTTLAGTGVASAFNVPANSVDSSKVVNESIRSIDIKNGAVRSADVADNNLTGTDVADGTLTTSELADGTVNAADVGTGAVGSSEALDNSLSAADLATGSVGTSELATGGVTPSDLSLQAQTRWAKVGADATPNLIAGRGATSVSRPGVGSFTVDFSQPIAGCAWTATINDNDAGGAPAGQISVERENAGDPDSLRVRTFTAAGAAADLAASDGFTVTVVC